ncbi:hypothetical protein P4O66_000016 [Electrophorus voltai]|uniref:Uncharacterized protein n=1 Tax=Electrophorus voltai TaxID=2609070 RepID=A0AAD8ZVT5_9TELE|nr:hypothetical protein P4O66_000016 [Electrophorus voltai]
MSKSRCGEKPYLTVFTSERVVLFNTHKPQRSRSASTWAHALTKQSGKNRLGSNEASKEYLRRVFTKLRQNLKDHVGNTLRVCEEVSFTFLLSSWAIGKRTERPQKHAFFRNVVHRHAALSQPAIAPEPVHPGSVDLLSRRKRKRESTRRQFWSRNRRCHQLLLVPKCCKPKGPNGSLRRFHAEHESYAGSRHAGHFQESCSSDTESSSISERLYNDSDFGSSLSTTTNSGTSDEEEDDSLSCSSDDSSDEESSSQSDSSSVSSQVSVQSIRFRRAGFSSLSTKAPLVLQPTFHYRPNLQHRSSIHGTVAALDCERALNFQKLDIATWRHRHRDSDASNVRKLYTVGNSFSGLRRDATPETVLHLDFSNDPKTTDIASSRIKDVGFTSGTDEKVFPQQRASGDSNKRYRLLVPHYTQDEDTIISKPSDNNLSVAANSKKDAKLGSCHKVPSPLRTIKREAEDPITAGNSSDSNTTGKIAPFPVNNVKIKVEDSFDEYEYATQGPGYQCKGNDVYVET